MNLERHSGASGVGSRGPIRTIIAAWLVAGTADITAASVYFPIAGRFRLIELYQGIASGVLGANAFNGGVAAAMLGLLLHYLIALIWTTFFFLIYPRLKLLQKNRLGTAVGFAVFVSCVMSFLVLPLSNVFHAPFNFRHFLISTAILMFTIGLPITTVVTNYYSTIDKNG